MKLEIGPSAAGLAILFALAGPCGVALGATMEQAMAQCKEQVSPIVRACVRQKMVANHDNDPEKYITGCRAPVIAQVKACVSKLIGAEGFKQHPVEDATAPAHESARTPAVDRPRVVPPRTIADITAILDQEKPDPARLKKLQAAADAPEPSKSDPVALAHFYFNRAVVRSELGRVRDAIADGEQAVQLGAGRVDQLVSNNFRMTVALQHISAGEPKQALNVFLKMAADSEQSNSKGFLFTAYRLISFIHLTLGDMDSAQSYVDKAQSLFKNARSIPGYSDHGGNWEANVEEAKGRLLEARGQIEDALKSFQRAEGLRRANIDKASRAMIAIPRPQLEQAADLTLLSNARIKSQLGRVAEAEGDARRALLNRLRATGKYAPQTTRFIVALGVQLVEQGRYEEARKLLSAAVDIYREIGMPEDTQTFVAVLSDLASVQALEGQWASAHASYAIIKRATENWEPARRAPFLTNFSRIETLYRNDSVEEGLYVGRRLLDFRIGRYGAEHPDTALARGHYAVGLALAKRDDEALKEFQVAVPLLTAMTFNTDNDDILNSAARTRYTQIVVENYIGLLGRLRAPGGPDIANVTFRLADSIRSRSVQKALTSAGARMTGSDPKLAATVRHEQDLRQQIGTQLGQLNSLLALPPTERDDAGVSTMRREIEMKRAEHIRVRAEIDRRFPEYADLIDPKPPTVGQIREVLRPGEALLSFYFGRDASFVWAISQDGKVEFAALKHSTTVITDKIKKLREALEPQAAMISDIPAFDLALAHELYTTLLEPVKAAWGQAKSLIVVTNGALGLLPLGVLTIAPHQLSTDGPIFSGYRSAPWLSRAYAVTMVPSASALRTLRGLPPGSDKREQLIAFGDPWFKDEQASHAATSGAHLAAAEGQTRGIPLKRRAGPQVEGANSMGIGELPRLPDTADELRSIALALEADPTKALHLGKEANEELVKKTDLSGFKIVAFATHGLVPGELDGLDQPALALSAPNVAGVEGDGLLTMEEILALKLDADWVVLSACNTGAGAGAGAEAASGLARAFFYAGTRAILVTNWSVHSQSARELVTDLFRRQSANSALNRGEALRQASMALLDGQGFIDSSGKTVFTYGHPLFWAPYSIIGDGGGAKH
jgi:CHAT domain-containing protein/tetratricopeptide (TPR) repeat protein